MPGTHSSVRATRRIHLPCSAQHRRSCESVARFVPRSDARIEQQHRLSVEPTLVRHASSSVRIEVSVSDEQLLPPVLDTELVLREGPATAAPSSKNSSERAPGPHTRRLLRFVRGSSARGTRRRRRLLVGRRAVVRLARVLVVSMKEDGLSTGGGAGVVRARGWVGGERRSCLYRPVGSRGSGEIGVLVRRCMSKMSRQAARRKGAPAGAKG
jgi:hypothetical protein